jgi:hypothetical protein
MKSLKEGVTISADVMLIPYYLDMTEEQAADFLERRYSDDEETEISANIELNEFIKDYKVEKLIKAIETASKENNNEMREAVMSQLYHMGEIALPQLKLKIIETAKTAIQLEYLYVAMSIIVDDPEEISNMFRKIISEDDEEFAEANTFVMKMLDDIDSKDFINRHPKQYKKEY